MNIISRYIIHTIVVSILIITLILMGIETLVVFIGELGNIGVGNYGALQALRFVVLDMPYQLNFLFPMAALVGSLIGLGVLASQSELIVMRASGFSNLQISGAVLKASLIIMLLALLLGEVVAPYTEYMARTGRAIAESGAQATMTRHGVWLRVGDDFIHVQQVLNKHQLKGVTSYDFDKQHRLQEAVSAAKANYRNGQWQLAGVDQTFIYNDHTQKVHLPQAIWKVQFDPALLNIADADPRSMSLVKLYTYMHYLSTNGLRSTSYALSFWKRLLQPLSAMVMIFLAVPFVFGPLRTVTMGLRIVTGIAVGFCFYILNQFFGPLSALYQIPPVLGAALPTLVFIGIGFVLMLRVR